MGPLLGVRVPGTTSGDQAVCSQRVLVSVRLVDSLPRCGTQDGTLSASTAVHNTEVAQLRREVDHLRQVVRSRSPRGGRGQGTQLTLSNKPFNESGQHGKKRFTAAKKSKGNKGTGKKGEKRGQEAASSGAAASNFSLEVSSWFAEQILRFPQLQTFFYGYFRRTSGATAVQVQHHLGLHGSSQTFQTQLKHSEVRCTYAPLARSIGAQLLS